MRARELAHASEPHQDVVQRSGPAAFSAILLDQVAAVPLLESARPACAAASTWAVPVPVAVLLGQVQQPGSAAAGLALAGLAAVAMC